MNKQDHTGSVKAAFLEHLIQKGILNPDSRVLDMGAGTSNPWGAIFAKYPDMHYTAIEPYTKALDEAKASFAHLPNKKFHNEFAYAGIEGFGAFDLCISLSTLEHVKQLPKMLEQSVKAVKSGGHIIHWYDLGHALYPSSLKERFQIFLGNHLPWALGEHKFVRYVAPQEVKQLLEKYGAEVFMMSNHQARNIKACLKVAQSEAEYEKISELSHWELENQEIIQRIPQQNREKLFPSIVVWAKKP